MPPADKLAALRAEMSAHHRRVIAVRLRVLENYCRTLLDLFTPLKAHLTRRKPLPAEHAEEIRRRVDDLVERIARMHRELNLEPAQVDARRQASALVSSMGVDLEELRPRYLKGYGEVPPSLAEYLDEQIGDCLDCVARLHRALDDAGK